MYIHTIFLDTDALKNSSSSPDLIIKMDYSIKAHAYSHHGATGTHILCVSGAPGCNMAHAAATNYNTEKITKNLPRSYWCVRNHSSKIGWFIVSS